MNKTATSLLPWFVGGGLLVLLAVGGASIGYAVSEDNDVGRAYSEILRHDPSALASSLVQVGTLHVQVGVAVAQFCLSLVVAMATVVYTVVTMMLLRAQPSPTSHMESAEAAQALAKAVEKLAAVLAHIEQADAPGSAQRVRGYPAESSPSRHKWWHRPGQ